jgi:DNA (cytosine-5)-methyltransferase 1
MWRNSMPSTDRVALEICSGAGGQAAGLEAAGFGLAAAVEIDAHACRTLRANRPHWRVLESDVRKVNGREFRGVDLLAGGVPCPPFSIAGKQLGQKDERDLFPEALRLVEEANPAAVLLENVPGFAMTRFDKYRNRLLAKLDKLGYWADWRVLNACSFGVAQLRPRFVLVAIRRRYAGGFSWPMSAPVNATVGQVLADLIREKGWQGADLWRTRARGIAPTIVGGSKKHGGPDLGPTRAKQQWRKLGVDGLGIADEAPPPEFPINGTPRLTVRMVARLQGFSDDWAFTGGKTAAYRQVGNAFPPPVAKAVGESISDALAGKVSRQIERQVPLFAAGD